MSVIGEQLLRSLPTTVLPSERAHRLNPSRRRYQLKRYRQASKDTFDDTSGTAKAEHRGHALAWHGMDLFDKGLGITVYMWAERIRQHVRVNLIDDTRSTFHFKSRHVNDDKFSTIRIQNSYCSERSNVASKYPHLASFNLWEKVFLLP